MQKLFQGEGASQRAIPVIYIHYPVCYNKKVKHKEVRFMSYLKIGGVMVVLLSLLCGAHYYLAKRISHCLQWLFPKFRFLHVLLALVFLTVMLMLSIARPFPGVGQRIISVIGTCWMGLALYLLLYMLAGEVVLLFSRLIPSVPNTLRNVTEATAIVLALLTFIGGFLHASRVQTVHYEVQLAEQPTSQMRVVMLSDVHLGAVNSEARLEKTVAAINAQQPDLVCIAGDIFDNNYSAIRNPEQVIQTLKQIQSTYGVYACLGNHDAGTEFGKMEAFLEQAGIRLLKDECVTIDGRLTLAGRLDPSPIGGYLGQTRQPLSVVLSGAEPKLPVVLLDHNPGSLPEYQGEAALILSGHTHKGQIFPGSLITNSLFTVDYGYYRAEDGTQVIVSSGAGTWGLPIRVGTDCEIVSILLTL